MRGRQRAQVARSGDDVRRTRRRAGAGRRRRATRRPRTSSRRGGGGGTRPTRDDADRPRRGDADPELPVLDVDAEPVPVDREHADRSSPARRTSPGRRRRVVGSRTAPRRRPPSRRRSPDRCAALARSTSYQPYARPMSGSRSKHATSLGDGGRVPGVVGIEERDQLAGGLGDAAVACGGHAGVRLADQPDAIDRRVRRPTPARSSSPPSSTSTTSTRSTAPAGNVWASTESSVSGRNRNEL